MRLLFAFLALVSISACGSIYESEPVTFGKDPAELKLSPCACLQVETPRDLPEFFKKMI